MSSSSSSETTCQLNERTQPPCHCLPFETSVMEIPTFILSGLWFQHPDLNPVNYKVCI